jgi:hypothetical protein
MQRASRVLKLFIGNSFTGVTVEPDERWTNMWRICRGDERSSMVNLTRAKDAAISWARPRGLGGDDVARWYRRQTGRRRPPMR